MSDTSPSTPSTVDEIRERLAAISGVEWRSVAVDFDEEGPTRFEISAYGDRNRVVVLEYVGIAYRHENAEFIAHAPEDMAHLLAQVDALTQDNAALKTLLASSMDSVDVLTAKAGQQGKMLTMVEASEAARMEHIRELQARVDELRELLGDVVR